MIDYFVDQLAEAFSRIEFDLTELRKHENDWVPDGDDGMFLFKGAIHPFVVKKYCVDLVREAGRLRDFG